MIRRVCGWLLVFALIVPVMGCGTETLPIEEDAVTGSTGAEPQTEDAGTEGGDQGAGNQSPGGYDAGTE